MCRSGHEECLLRFDELSREAESVNADVANDSTNQDVACSNTKQLKM